MNAGNITLDNYLDLEDSRILCNETVLNRNKNNFSSQNEK